MGMGDPGNRTCQGGRKRGEGTGEGDQKEGYVPTRGVKGMRGAKSKGSSSSAPPCSWFKKRG